MLISLQARLAYLAMTKTGTTAVEDALRPFCEITFSRSPLVTHMTVRRYNRHIVPYLNALKIEGIETCAVIRHPVAWLASWYQYRQRADLAASGISTANISFEAFVEDYIGNTRTNRAMGRPWDFLRDQDFALGIDHLFRYEAFDRFHNFLQDRFDRDLPLRTINSSPPGEASLSPQLLGRLETFLDKEFEIYDSLP